MINLLQSFLESTLSSKSPDQCGHLTQSCKIWGTPTQLYIFTQVLRPFTAKNNESDLPWLNVPRDAVLPPGPAQDCTASTSTRWPITNYLQLLYCWIRFILIIILLFIISFSLTWLDIDIHQFRFVIVVPCKQCHFPQLFKPSITCQTQSFPGFFIISFFPGYPLFLAGTWTAPKFSHSQKQGY